MLVTGELLYGCEGLHDEGLEHLAALSPTVRSVELGGCQHVTAEGLACLAAMLPPTCQLVM